MGTFLRHSVDSWVFWVKVTEKPQTKKKERKKEGYELTIQDEQSL